MEYWTLVFRPSFTKRQKFQNCGKKQYNVEEIGFEESGFAKGTKTRSTFPNQCRKERLGRIKQVRFPTILATVLTGCHRWPGGRPENIFSQSIWWWPWQRCSCQRQEQRGWEERRSSGRAFVGSLSDGSSSQSPENWYVYRQYPEKVLLRILSKIVLPSN